MKTQPAAPRTPFAGVDLVELATTGRVPTPFYAYDLDGIRGAVRGLRDGYGERAHLVAYAVKANAAGPVLRAIAAEGAGADVVSGAELALAQAAGIAPSSIVFSGVAKRDDEIDRAVAASPTGILAISAESVEELERIAARARVVGRRARVSLRVNPGVETDTHAHISTGHDDAKFGISLADVDDAFAALASCPELSLVGLSCHVGSQLVAVDDYAKGARALAALAAARRDRAPSLEFIDFGGGFGIDYGAGCPARPADFARVAVDVASHAGLGDLRIVCEPGRSIVGAHGVLVAKVIQTKTSRSGRRWLMIDAGMNDLLRPALYQARHRIEALDAQAGAPTAEMRVVGPVCESSDDFGDFELPCTSFGHVAIRDVGAYGYAMASRYNGRSLPAEVFVEGGSVAGVFAATRADEWVRDRLDGPRQR